MLNKRSISRSGIGRTILIVLGIIIALLMTIKSPLLTAEFINLTKCELEPVAKLNFPKDQNSNSKGYTGSSFNSTTVKMFQHFTVNLPFLNHK